MSNRQEPDHFLKSAFLFVFTVIILHLIHVYEPVGSFSPLFQSALATSIRLCFSVADYIQGLGEGISKGWHADRLPPYYVVYALKILEFGADLLWYTGTFLASQAISYSNYGSGNPFMGWLARFVLKTRALFLPNEVFNVSFTPTWTTALWPFKLT